VCERIPYLILPVTQLSREPFGSRQSDMRKPSGSRRACVEQPPTICRASRRRGITNEPSAEVLRASRRAIRRACLDPNPYAEATLASCRARRQARLEPKRAAPSTERSVERAIAAEPRTIWRSSRSQQVPQIPN